jgi:hypothetical protein
MFNTPSSVQFIRRITVCSLLMFIQACCIPIEQTVQEPNRAWERAFSQKPPANITVVNGWHWSSGHFSGEYAWFLEINAEPGVIQQLIDARGLTQRLDSAEHQAARQDIWSQPPGWFAPITQQYDIYHNPEMHYAIFVVRDSNTAYLCQWSI